MDYPEKSLSQQDARPDPSILADIWNALQKESLIRSLDLDDISVTVQAGEVLLEGHVAREQNKLLIETLSKAAPGVTAVHNLLVTDRDLSIEVAQALSNDPRTHPFILRVGSNHGWVSLSGEVPSPEFQLAVEEVVSQIRSVRGIISLPKVAGASSTPARRVIQPRVGSSVHGRDGQAGLITKVVIDPCSRLVTNVVVRANHSAEQWPVFGEYVLPEEAIEHVNPESVILTRAALPTSRFPVFDPTSYPPPATDWQPPYPYAFGDVRWPHPARPTFPQPVALRQIVRADLFSNQAVW